MALKAETVRVGAYAMLDRTQAGQGPPAGPAGPSRADTLKHHKGRVTTPAGSDEAFSAEVAEGGV